MSNAPPTQQISPTRTTAEEYFGLVERCILDPDDRVELLEGVIVACEPQNPWHASGVRWVSDALHLAIGNRALVTTQSPFVAGEFSVPEPDVFVVPGSRADYLTRHPTMAHLIVEVSDSSWVQDRLTKAAIYAAAGVPEYWIVSRRNDLVQVATQAVVSERRYALVRMVRRGEGITLTAFPDITVPVDDLIPR